MTKNSKDSDDTDIFNNSPTPNFDDFPKLDDLPSFDDFPELGDDFFKTLDVPPFENSDDSIFRSLPDFDAAFESTSEPVPPPDPSLTAADAAKWMRDEVERTGHLDQERAAWHVKRHFGDRFTHINRNGNLAIAPEVLKEFRELTKDTAVWCKRERYWRKRQPGDSPGREVPC